MLCLSLDAKYIDPYLFEQKKIPYFTNNFLKKLDDLSKIDIEVANDAWVDLYFSLRGVKLYVRLGI